uniref:Uncharacterized protein n=1 Tax=Arundo donax TaxID=35708 RepID=A0A0A9EC91_ARUDO
MYLHSSWYTRVLSYCLGEFKYYSELTCNTSV